MEPILSSHRQSFLEAAERHFCELNPDFVPQSDWKQHYFEGIQSNPNLRLRWIVAGAQRAGFILFGFEDHRFLPRKTGAIYELYIGPEFRRQGIARASAQLAIRELRAGLPSKIQLEVVEGNVAAERLWRSLGFQKVTARYVLRDGAK